MNLELETLFMYPYIYIYGRPWIVLYTQPPPRICHFQPRVALTKMTS